MSTFEIRTKRAGMDQSEIQKFVGDFTEALVRLALMRVREVEVATQAFASKFDTIAGSLNWKDASTLATVGIDIAWVTDMQDPHRTFMHPDFVTHDTMWGFVREYIAISMVSDKRSRVLFPNLARSRKPPASSQLFLNEARILNRYLRRVQQAGLSGDRIISYRGDLKTHGQGQNDIGFIGAVGAAVAIRDALQEISPCAIVSAYGTIPAAGSNSPAEIAQLVQSDDYLEPRALLLSSQRAVIFTSDPDVAIVSRIGGQSYSSAEEAANHWNQLRRQSPEQRNAAVHQAALGEVKTALDTQNLHERLALGSREDRDEAFAQRFLLMAILTNDIVDPERDGRRALYSPDARRFADVFNLYFAWGYDSARAAHPEHWNDFKKALKKWTAL
jgi:hypothetical protein